MTSLKNKRNPYIVGPSIDEPERFFGRENIFTFIEDNLSNNQKVILLHGQRRIGKSSVLKQIPQKVNLDDKFVFVLLDFQDKSQWSFHEIIHKLAEEIFEHLEIPTNDLASIQDLEKYTDKFSQLLNLIRQELGNRNLVLLLDEFDVLDSNNNDSGFEEFFGYLRQIVFQEKQLFIIPVVGRRLSDMPKLLELFKSAPHLRIGLLDEYSTKSLITKPARGSLQYHDRAINEIIRLSAGHPYFTQAICYALFVQAREKEKGEILGSDVDNRVIDDAIELSEAGLAWFRDGLMIPEKVVFSAVATSQEKAKQNYQSRPEEALKLLKSFGVETDQLHSAKQNLINNDFLDADGYKVTVEFVRRWLVKKSPLQSEIWELEKLGAEVNDYYEKANIWRNRGNIDNELNHYRMALELNANHFSALFRLAELYQKDQKFPEALELYERAYKVHPERVKEGYIEALLSHGDHYFQNNRSLKRHLVTVKKLYEKVLEIEPNNAQAQDKIKYLINKEKPINIPIRFVILPAVLAVPLLIGIGIFLGQRIRNLPVPQSETTPTLPPEEKRQRFSSGENTVFPDNNQSYSSDILTCNQEFQDKNYGQATNCFEKLVNANRNEPEPLIYYNNSLALSYDNPLTIAVAVPADTNSKRAKAMLRGVAQAQNEYNKKQKNSPSPRLLEIVIANDSNNDEISPKIAQEIVENKDILGVIGHQDSSVSKAALEVYEKEGLAMVTSTSTSTELEGKVFFRTNINNKILSQKIAEELQDLGIEKVVVFYNGHNSFSRNIKEHFNFHFTSLNPGNQVEFEDSNKQVFNTRNAVEKAVDNGFQAAILFQDTGTINLAIKIAYEIAQANDELPEEQRLKLFSPGTLYDCDTLNQGKQAVKGLILAVPWHKELDTAQKFLGRAKDQWGGPVEWRAATSYDAAKAFIYALSNSGNNPTRAKVLEEVKEVNVPPEETSSGQNLRFNPDREVIREAILVKVFEEPNKDCSDLNFRLFKE